VQPAGFPGWLGAAHAESSVRNLGDLPLWVEPDALGNQVAAAAEVGGARSTEEAG